MKSVFEYIVESQITSSNKERLEQLRKLLKGKKYEDYVDTLSEMLKDPKTKTLLDAGFGTEFGDLKFKFSIKMISADDLLPSQNEIDIDKTIGAAFKTPDNVTKNYTTPIVIANMPLVTFNGKYVIDGHHRWSEVCVINPEGKMLCFDYSANITIEQMLKAVQGTIAAVMAKKNEPLPKQKVQPGHNIYEMSKNDIEKYVEENENIDTYQNLVQFNKKIKNNEQAKQFIIDNLQKMKEEKQPPKGAPEREYMPQTSKGGSDTKDKQTSFPDKTGSALNNLSTKTIDKKSIK